MLQVKKGIIDLDRPLYEYLPNDDLADDERYKRITACMVLCHVSCLSNWKEAPLISSLSNRVPLIEK